MTWMTPLLAMTSVATTLAPATVTLPSLRRSAGRCLALALFMPATGGGHVAGDDVVGQDPGKLVLVFRLQQVGDRGLAELGEGVVGQGEHRKRALPERVSRAGPSQRRAAC